MNGGESFDEVVATIRARVTPDGDETELLADVVTEVTTRAEEAIKSLDVDADVVHVGSTARGTWVSGDRDVDVFIRFPPSLDRTELEQYGLEVGHQVLPDGHEEYAEHPYVTGDLDGVDVDLVPCYRVEDATDIRSAVDRTPFHDTYLTPRLTDELREDIRVAKQFLTGFDAYGSNLQTQGFSGYLTELLILEFDGFRGFVEAASDWVPPVTIDPVGHTTADFDERFVVVDPTDPSRNVAAVVSHQNLARVQHYARELLATPDTSLFEPTTPEPLTPQELRTVIESRGTAPVAVVFDAPDIVDDQLYPQLRRSLTGFVRGLDDRGFDVLRAATWARDRAVLYVEPRVDTLPRVERHEGPPVHVTEHATRFYDTYDDDESVYGPFIDGDRYVVERKRDVRTPAEFAREHLHDVSLGTHVETALDTEYSVLAGTDVTTLLPEFGIPLARYYDPIP